MAIDTQDEATANGQTSDPTRVLLTNPQDVNAVADVIKMFLADQGSATKAEIRQYLAAIQVPTALYQKAFDRLHRQLKAVIETTSPDGSKHWTLAEWLRSQSQLTTEQMIALVDNVSATKAERENYGAWIVARGAFVLTGDALSSNPDPEDQSMRRFLRTADDDVLLSPGYFKGMIADALAKPGFPETARKAMRWQAVWYQQELPASSITKVMRPVPPDREGMPGKGLTTVEALPAGTEIPFGCVFPGSHVSEADFESILNVCGLFVGFSPSAAHKGWGRFTPRIDEIEAFA